MSHEDLTDLPSPITQGTSVDYRRTYSEFSASDGWTAKLYLAGRSAALEITGSADGNSFNFSLTDANTTSLLPGVYRWQEFVTKAGKTQLATEGTVEIVQSLVGATAGAAESFNAAQLRAIEAAIVTMLAGGVIESYRIGAREFHKPSLRDLYDLRARLRQAVNQEAHPGRMGPSVRVTFPGIESELPPVWS